MIEPEARSKQPRLRQWWSDLCAQLCQRGSGLKTGVCHCSHPVTSSTWKGQGLSEHAALSMVPLCHCRVAQTVLIHPWSPAPAWAVQQCLDTGLPFLVSQQESCVFSAIGAGHSWPGIIRRPCVSWFNCNVAYLLEEKFMNNKCSSIKSKIRFSSAAISPAVSPPLFFPIAFIFKTRGFIFHLQNHHTQECKSGVRC